MSGSGISWNICTTAPRSRQITTPAPHRSVFYRPDALPAAQPTASKHWRPRSIIDIDIGHSRHSLLQLVAASYASLQPSLSAGRQQHELNILISLSWHARSLPPPSHGIRKPVAAQPDLLILTVMVYFVWQCFQCFDTVGWHQQEHPACKNWVMRCWCGYLSGARCRLFAYGPVDAITIPQPHHLSPFKSKLVLPFWYRLTQVATASKNPITSCLI